MLKEEELIRVITCEPKKVPQEVFISKKIQTIVDFLGGYFEVSGIDKSLILYCRERFTGLQYNRLVGERPIYGNFIISKIKSDGKRSSLTHEDLMQMKCIQPIAVSNW